MKLKRVIIPYTCPRCCHKTPTKDSMRKHLYARKTQCSNINKMELTDEIRNVVLNDRIYAVPKHTKKTTINNTINYISQINVFDAHQQYLSHLGIELLDFNDGIENKYKKQIESLKNNQSKCHIEYNHDDFVDMVQDITKNQQSTEPENINEYNVLYDNAQEKLKIYKDDEWSSYRLEIGAVSVVNSLKIIYLDEYETYMIKKIITGKVQHLIAKFKQQIEDYYKFIICFNLEPVVQDCCDAFILDLNQNGDKSYKISETYCNIYQKLKDTMKKGEKNNIVKKVTKIVKKMATHNKIELNRKFAALFGMDKEFEQIISNLLVSKKNNCTIN